MEKIFRRFVCPKCKRRHNIYESKKESVINCKCGHNFKIKPTGGLYYVEYYCKLKRIREKVGDNITLARNALKQREIDVSNEKFLGKEKKRRIKFDDFCTEYLENAKLKKKSWKKSDWVQINALKTVFSGKYLDEICSLS